MLWQVQLFLFDKRASKRKNGCMRTGKKRPDVTAPSTVALDAGIRDEIAGLLATKNCLREFREAADLSLEDLARRCHLSISMLSRFETNDRKLSEKAFLRVLAALIGFAREIKNKTDRPDLTEDDKYKEDVEFWGHADLMAQFRPRVIDGLKSWVLEPVPTVVKRWLEAELMVAAMRKDTMELWDHRGVTPWKPWEKLWLALVRAAKQTSDGLSP